MPSCQFVADSAKTWAGISRCAVRGRDIMRWLIAAVVGRMPCHVAPALVYA